VMYPSSLHESDDPRRCHYQRRATAPRSVVTVSRRRADLERIVALSDAGVVSPPVAQYDLQMPLKPFVSVKLVTYGGKPVLAVRCSFRAKIDAEG
jgi:hypothetical protein